MKLNSTNTLNIRKVMYILRIVTILEKDLIIFDKIY